MREVKGKVVNIEGVTFAGLTTSNHWIPIDGPDEFGGSDGAARPKELMLIALAGCTGSDVSSIMTKKRVPFTRFEVHTTAQETGEHPKVYKSIHVTYKIWGDGIKEKDVQKAIDLSRDVYCGVTAMLKDSIELTDSFEINPAE